MRRYLDELGEKELVKTEGKKNYMYYMIGKGEEKDIMFWFFGVYFILIV
jgi:hypothetical protein